jgi:outer membrane protein OmpA-like peptidoglycan-associated protein
MDTNIETFLLLLLNYWILGQKLQRKGCNVTIRNLFINVLFSSIIFPVGVSLANDKGFVLQNGSAVVDSSETCIRTGSTEPSATPGKCGGAQTAIEDNAEVVEEPAREKVVEMEPVLVEQMPNEKITTEVAFMFDKSNLTSIAIEKLDSFITEIQKRVSNIINVFGHTDSLGTNPYNDRLSESRANAVKNYLIESGVPNNEISVSGMGENYPVADNETSNGRAKNRRVVIEAE